MTSTTNSDIAKKHLKLRVRLPLYPVRDQTFDSWHTRRKIHRRQAGCDRIYKPINGI